MKPPIGFVLITHADAEQTLDLCERLTAMFEHPPIAIHHDFSQTSLNTSLFPKNVRFVEKCVLTSWGNLSVIEAQMAALRLLYATGDPEWFVALSGTDYPIQTADCILRDLFDHDFDVYIDTRRVENLRIPMPDEGLGEQSFRHPVWKQIGYDRYVAIPVCSIRMARRLHMRIEDLSLPFEFLTKRLTPFQGPVQCYGGDGWVTGNQRVAALLTDETPLWKDLHRHYRGRQVPEESFYHTLIGNSPEVRFCTDNKRYTDWRGCCAHPRTLGVEDFPRLLASTHHFARKFEFDPEMLRKLDQEVEHKAVRLNSRQDYSPLA